MLDVPTIRPDQERTASSGVGKKPTEAGPDDWVVHNRAAEAERMARAGLITPAQLATARLEVTDLTPPMQRQNTAQSHNGFDFNENRVMARAAHHVESGLGDEVDTLRRAMVQMGRLIGEVMMDEDGFSAAAPAVKALFKTLGMEGELDVSAVDGSSAALLSRGLGDDAPRSSGWYRAMGESLQENNRQLVGEAGC
jgi:hypothetical protein